VKIFYCSKRIGKNGKVFNLYKFRTLQETKGQFPEEYTKIGRFLRKTKIDELPQIINLIKGDMNIVGPRPEEARTVNLLPDAIKKILLSRRPGLTSLSSLHFFDEGNILEKGVDLHRIYWEKIKPLKILLDVFYVNERNILLDWWIILKTLTAVIKSFWER